MHALIGVCVIVGVRALVRAERTSLPDLFPATAFNPCQTIRPRNVTWTVTYDYCSINKSARPRASGQERGGRVAQRGGHML